MSNNFKNLKSLSLKVFSTITISSCLSSWWYRPVIDHQNGQGLRRIGWISQIDYQNVIFTFFLNFFLTFFILLYLFDRFIVENHHFYIN